MRPFFLRGHSRPLTSVKFNRDGDIFFTAGKDANLLVWFTNNGHMLGSYKCDNGVVWSIDCTLDSSRLIAASADQKVLIFDVNTGEVLYNNNEGAPCKHVEWNGMPGNQNRYVLATDEFLQTHKQIKIISMESGHPKLLWSTSEYTGKCTDVHWGPLDSTIISCHDNGMLNVWDARYGGLISDHVAHNQQITCAAMSQDRLLMLTCCVDGTAKLWDTMQYRCLKTYLTDRHLNACSISPLYNASGSERRCHVFLAGGQDVSEVTTTAASEGRFDTLVHHMVFGDLLGSIRGHFGPVHALDCMPNGAGFVSGGEDGYARLYHFDDDYFSSKFE